jgi:hypothetical protein
MAFGPPADPRQRRLVMFWTFPMTSWREEVEAKMPDRGIIYMVWGNDDRTQRALARSRQSVQSFHPELPIEVIRIEADDRIKGLLEKSLMFRRSPFRETLYLDADTVVLGRLDFGFRKAQDFGLVAVFVSALGPEDTLAFRVK